MRGNADSEVDFPVHVRLAVDEGQRPATVRDLRGVGDIVECSTGIDGVEENTRVNGSLVGDVALGIRDRLDVVELADVCRPAQQQVGGVDSGAV